MDEMDIFLDNYCNPQRRWALEQIEAYEAKVRLEEQQIIDSSLLQFAELEKAEFAATLLKKDLGDLLIECMDAEILEISNMLDSEAQKMYAMQVEVYKEQILNMSIALGFFNQHEPLAGRSMPCDVFNAK